MKIDIPLISKYSFNSLFQHFIIICIKFQNSNTQGTQLEKLTTLSSMDIPVSECIADNSSKLGCQLIMLHILTAPLFSERKIYGIECTYRKAIQNIIKLFIARLKGTFSLFPAILNMSNMVSKFSHQPLGNYLAKLAGFNIKLNSNNTVPVNVLHVLTWLRSIVELPLNHQMLLDRMFSTFSFIHRNVLWNIFHLFRREW